MPTLRPSGLDRFSYFIEKKNILLNDVLIKQERDTNKYVK